VYRIRCDVDDSATVQIIRGLRSTDFATPRLGKARAKNLNVINHIYEQEALSSFKNNFAADIFTHSPSAI
jgi:hypothetical protein